MEDGDGNFQAAWERALRLLARREHSTRELTRKLTTKGVSLTLSGAVVDELERCGYVSDRRFAEVFVRSRMERGQGPRRIQHELRERGVADAVIDEYLDPGGSRWEELLRAVRERKFGKAPPGSYVEWARQARFLQNRGFSAEQIRKVVDYEEQS